MMNNPEKHQCTLTCSRSLYLPLACGSSLMLLSSLYCSCTGVMEEKRTGRACGEPTFVKRLRGKPPKLVSSFTDLVMIIEIDKYSLSLKKTEFFSSFAFCDLERRVEKSQS